MRARTILSLVMKMKGNVNIAGLSVSPGKKEHGLFEISRRAGGGAIGLPVIIINGHGEGPTLCLDACNHGDEYEGVEAIVRLAKNIDPRKLNGNLICIPVLNVMAFEAGLRVNPYEYYRIDMNRSYPGKNDGWLTERIAFRYFEEIVTKSDYVISFHGGGTYLSPCEFTIYASGYGAVSETSRELARFFGLKFISVMKFGGSFTIEVAKRGIPSIVAEIGAHSDRYTRREYYVRLGMDGVINVMKHLDMLDGKAKIPKGQVYLDSNIVRARKGGLWVPRIEVGKSVSKGQILGEIFDLFGEKIESIESPLDGVAYVRWDFPAIQAGSYAYFLGKPI